MGKKAKKTVDEGVRHFRHPYRVFVSYSHEDRDLAKELVKRLAKTGLHPIWDKNLRPGDPFSEAIKHGIAHSHMFIPLLTKRSVKRPWVHQETGYAMGIEVPVLPPLRTRASPVR